MASNNPDILLVVGADAGLSYDQFISDIEGIVDRINKNPPHIKIELDIDKAQIENLSAQISNISKKITSFSATPAMPNLNTGAVTKQINDATLRAAELAAIMKEIDATNSTITSSYKTISNALGGASAIGANAQELDAIKQKYTELIYAVNLLKESKESATQEDINNIYRLQSETDGLIRGVRNRINAEKEKVRAEKAAEKEANDRNQLTKQYITLLNQMVAAEKNWSAARRGSEAGSYKDIERSVKNIQTSFGDFANGEMSISGFRDKLDEVRVSFSANSRAIKEAGKDTLSFGDNIASVGDKLKSLITFSRVAMAAIRTLREMVSISIELDAAMTQLKIVTNETESSYEKFGNKIADIAQEIGSSITDLMESSTTYARLGYSLDESSILAKYTAMLENVGKSYCLTA